jgi:excisionase family DNA binding protein
LPAINPVMSAKYGLEIPSFIIENVSLPPEVEQAIDKRSSMAAVGNLNDYVKFQMAESMTRGEGGGMANTAAQFGAGMAMGQQMMAAMGTAQATPSAAPTPVGAGGGLPELLSPADVAQFLGVTEADVMTALSDGSLKGKRIGSAWRITRSALDEFLKH